MVLSIFLAHFIGTIPLVLAFFLSVIIGLIIGKMIFSSKGPDLQAEVDRLNQELKASKKSENTLNKQVGRHATEKEDLSTKLASANEKIKTNTAQLSTANSLTAEQEKTILDLQKKHNDLTNKFEMTQKRMGEVQAKLAEDRKDSKTWKKEISDLDLLYKQELQKTERLQRRITEFQDELKEFNTLKEEVNPIKRTLKGRDKEIVRLKSDIEYWEKKHYDAHHELTKIKNGTAALEEKIKNLTDTINGQKIQQENMKKMISDYKGNLITANEKYYNLARQLEN